MLRIELVEEAPNRLRVTLHGTLSGRWVDELRRLLDEHSTSALALDLAELRFMDAAGEALMQVHLARGAEVARCSPYIAAALGVDPR